MVYPEEMNIFDLSPRRRYYSFRRKTSIPIAIKNRKVIQHGRTKMVEVFPGDVEWHDAPFEVAWLYHPSIIDKLIP